MHTYYNMRIPANYADLFQNGWLGICLLLQQLYEAACVSKQKQIAEYSIAINKTSLLTTNNAYIEVTLGKCFVKKKHEKRNLILCNWY